MATDRLVVDVVIMNVDDFVDRVFALKRDKREPCNISHQTCNVILRITTGLLMSPENNE